MNFELMKRLQAAHCLPAAERERLKVDEWNSERDREGDPYVFYAAGNVYTSA